MVRSWMMSRSSSANAAIIVRRPPAKPINTGQGASAIAITPDGKTAYVANSRVNTVTPIDTATNAPGRGLKAVS